MNLLECWCTVVQSAWQDLRDCENFIANFDYQLKAINILSAPYSKGE